MFSLIIPTYNEAANILGCIARVKGVLAGREFEIIVVDDDSPDLTWKVVEECRDPQVSVIRRTQNRGLSGSVREGFRASRGTRLGVMDADLQHDESILPQLIDALNDHDIAVGSREVQGGSKESMVWYRRLMSNTARTLCEILVSDKVSDPMSGFFTLRRETFEKVSAELVTFPPRDYKILLQILSLCGDVRCKEIGFEFRERIAGESKLDLATVWGFIKSLLKARNSQVTQVLEMDIEFPRLFSKEISLVRKVDRSPEKKVDREKRSTNISSTSP
jgi:dolichol-phosphate mannosyltransferase